MLSLLLILPIFFVILVFFGQNYYQLPKYNPQSVKKGADGEIDTVYHRIKPYLNKNYFAERVKTNELNVFHICDKPASENFRNVTANLASVQETYKDEKRFSLFALLGVDSTVQIPQLEKKYGTLQDNWHFLRVSENFEELQKEGFKLDSNYCSRLVLADKGGVIRGYYDGLKQKEIDRLITEINVLIHEYEHKIPEREDL